MEFYAVDAGAAEEGVGGDDAIGTGGDVDGPDDAGGGVGHEDGVVV